MGLIHTIITIVSFVLMVATAFWIFDMMQISNDEMKQMCDDAGGEKLLYKSSCFIDGHVKKIVQIAKDDWRLEK